MRALTNIEIATVAGGAGECPAPAPEGNNLGGVSDAENLGDDLINIYEGLVEATSHIIERVANAM